MKDKSQYHLKVEIRHRVDRLSKDKRREDMSIAKQNTNLQILMSKLKERIYALHMKEQTTQDELHEAEEQLKLAEREFKELGFKNETIISEHAMLRYCERFLGIDMEKVHQDILKLPKKDVIKSGNVVITVYPTPEDPELDAEAILDTELKELELS